MGIGTLRRHYRPWEHGLPVSVPEPVVAPEPTSEEVAAAELHKRAVELVVAAGHSVEVAEKLISEIGAEKVLEEVSNSKPPSDPDPKLQELEPKE